MRLRLHASEGVSTVAQHGSVMVEMAQSSRTGNPYPSLYIDLVPCACPWDFQRTWHRRQRRSLLGWRLTAAKECVLLALTRVKEGGHRWWRVHGGSERRRRRSR